MPNKLSKEVIAEYRETFKLFDSNGDGSITLSELRDVMKSLISNPTEAELRDMINEVDTDGNGTVDFNEFCAMMEKKKEKSHLQDELKNAFLAFDKDGDGFISPDELRDVMKALKIDLTDKEHDAIIDAADSDSDGQLSYEEFATMMMY